MQICFPNHIGLPGQPQSPAVDGYIEPEEFIVEPGFGTGPSQVDPGWAQSSRITYVADTSVGAGRPLMVFQGIKHNSADTIYLSFVVRRDTAFDEQDRIILVFHPNFATGSAGKTGDERRIDILPNYTGVGAGAAGSSDPGDFSGSMGGSAVTIRANRPPRNVEYYRWDTGSSAWTSISTPSGVDIRVRSWDLGTNNKNWSVELQLPTSIAAGGANWINLGSSFGFYFNVIRICSGTECTFGPTLFDGAAFQFTWPRADYTAPTDRLITGEIDVSQADIPSAWLGEAFLGNVPGCSGVAGVKFQSGAASIGVLSGTTITNEIHATNPNTFVARVVNTATTDAEDVTAEFRIANWGIGPGDNNKWNLISPDTGFVNPSAPATITGTPSGGTPTPVDLTTRWTLDPVTELPLYGDGKALDDHQCVWVLLDSVQNVDFTESSIRRNMNFVGLSEHENTAEISGDGYPDPPQGMSDQDFALIVSQMLHARLVRRGENGPKPGEDVFTGRQAAKTSTGRLYQEPGNFLGRLLWLLQSAINRFQVVYEWFWVMDGYRKTEFALAAGGKKYEIFQPAGAFGYIGQHEGLVQRWNQSVRPAPGDEARLTATQRDAYRLQVPNRGRAHIVTRLEAQEFKTIWWLWLLILLLLPILLIIWLIRRLSS